MSELTNIGVSASIDNLVYAFNPVALHIGIQKSEVFGRGNYTQTLTNALSTTDGQPKVDTGRDRFFYVLFNFEKGEFKKAIYPAFIMSASADPDNFGCVFYENGAYIQGSGVLGRDVATLDGQLVEIDIPDNADSFGFCYYNDAYADQIGIARSEAITFISPDELGDDTQIRISAGSEERGFIDFWRSTYNAETVFDLRGIAETIFDRKQFYNVQEVDQTLIKQMTIHVYRLNAGAEAFVGTLNTYVLWGALQIGEVRNLYPETMKMFSGYPFTLPLLLDRAFRLKVRADSNSYQYEAIIGKGQYLDFTRRDIAVRYSDGVLETLPGVNFDRWSTFPVQVVAGDVLEYNFTGSKGDTQRTAFAFYDEAGQYVQSLSRSEAQAANGNTVEFTQAGSVIVTKRSTYKIAKAQIVSAVGVNPVINKYNIDLSRFNAAERITVRLEPLSSDPQPTIFSNAFDVTFKGKAEDTRLIDINVCKCDFTGGVYLRWVNKLGEFNYWLFRCLSNDATVKASDVSFKELFYTTRLTDPLNSKKFLRHDGTGQYIGKDSTHSIQLAAANVTPAEFDFLSAIIESPLVDMFMGYDESGLEQWVRVSVPTNNISKNRQELQDFRFTIDKPQILTQKF